MNFAVRLKAAYWVLRYRLSMARLSKAVIHWPMHAGCNLSCEYCFLKERPPSEFHQRYRAEDVIRFFDNLPYPVKVNLTGHEPFLFPDFVNIAKHISQRHIISLVTNLVHAEVKHFADTIDPHRIFGFTASVHLAELEKRGLVETFIENFLYFRKKGFYPGACVVAHPSLLKDLDRWRETFGSRGIKLIFKRFVGSYDGKSYPSSYSEEELKLFGLPASSVESANVSGELCNAGINTCIIRTDGTLTPCYHYAMKMGDLNSLPAFSTRFIKCQVSCCTCPFFAVERDLWLTAVFRHPLSFLRCCIERQLK